MAEESAELIRCPREAPAVTRCWISTADGGGGDVGGAENGDNDDNEEEGMVVIILLSDCRHCHRAQGTAAVEVWSSVENKTLSDVAFV